MFFLIRMTIIQPIPSPATALAGYPRFEYKIQRQMTTGLKVTGTAMYGTTKCDSMTSNSFRRHCSKEIDH
jgi:hypothetical protein